MTSSSNVTLSPPPLAKRDLAKFGAARLRDQMFDAVSALWRRRQYEGWTQGHLADQLGRDKGWVSRNLRAPGNWTLKTAGEFIQALDGEAIVTVEALEDKPLHRDNFNAYDSYEFKLSTPIVSLTLMAENQSVGTYSIGSQYVPVR